MPLPLWTLDEVSLPGYRKRNRLDGITLSILTGSTVVLGYSGAGKTSLLNVLVDFETPQGKVTFRRPLGTRLPIYWSPSDYGLWPFLTVRGHLLAVVADQDADRTRVESLLKEFDLEHCDTRYPHDLSLGERSRLSVARALAARAGVIVLDEPLDHVDQARLPRFWAVLRRELNQSQTSLVFTTHSPDAALRLADRAICLKEGRVLWDGDIQTLYSSPPTRELAGYLGPVNWVETDVRRQWQLPLESPIAVRPHSLEIVPDEAGPGQILEHRFMGTHHEVVVEHLATGTSEGFVAQVRQPLTVGQRVQIRLIPVVLLCLSFLLSGCGESSSPMLEFQRVRSLKMPIEPSRFPAPRGMVYGPKDELLVLDDIGRVIRYDSTGNVDKVWWMPDYKIGRPEGIRVLLDGRMAVADTHYHRVVLFDSEGAFSGTIGQRGTALGDFEFPVGLTQDSDGFLYVADYGGTDRITKFSASGTPILMFGGLGSDPGQMQRPSGVAWHKGQVYVADAINNRIQQFTDEGKFVSVLADAEKSDLHYPYNVMIGPDECLYVVEYGGCRVTKLSLSGTVLGRYGHAGRGSGEFWTPWGLAVDSNGRIAVADTGNRRIIELTP